MSAITVRAAPQKGASPSTSPAGSASPTDHPRPERRSASSTPDRHRRLHTGDNDQAGPTAVGRRPSRCRPAARSAPCSRATPRARGSNRRRSRQGRPEPRDHDGQAPRPGGLPLPGDRRAASDAGARGVSAREAEQPGRWVTVQKKRIAPRQSHRYEGAAEDPRPVPGLDHRRRRHAPPDDPRAALKFQAASDDPGVWCDCCRGCRVDARCRLRSGLPAIAGCSSCCRAPLLLPASRSPRAGRSRPRGRSTRSPRPSARSPASPRLSRTVRSSLCAMALLACCAILVVAWHGTVEAHFHYFVMVGALALYEEWWAYLLAIAFVVLQHGAMGAIRAETVFNHVHDPWRWAAIHGLFVAALALTNLISWRESERGREDTGAPRNASAARSTTRRSRWPSSPRRPRGAGQSRAASRTGHQPLEGLWFWDFVPAGDRAALEASWPPAPDARGGAPLRPRRRRHRLVPLAPLVIRDPTASPTTTSPRASTSPPASATPSASTTRPTTTR